MSPSNCTRKAISSDLMRLLSWPGDIVSVSPVRPAVVSRGSAQSGPCTRGKSRKNAAISGSAWITSASAGRNRSDNVGVLPIRLKPIIVATKIQTHTSM